MNWCGTTEPFLKPEPAAPRATRTPGAAAAGAAEAPAAGARVRPPPPLPPPPPPPPGLRAGPAPAARPTAAASSPSRGRQALSSQRHSAAAALRSMGSVGRAGGRAARAPWLREVPRRLLNIVFNNGGSVRSEPRPPLLSHPTPAQRRAQRPLLNTLVQAPRPPLQPRAESGASAVPPPRTAQPERLAPVSRQVTVTDLRLPEPPRPRPPVPRAGQPPSAPRCALSNRASPSGSGGAGCRACPPNVSPTSPERSTRPLPAPISYVGGSARGGASSRGVDPPVGAATPWPPRTERPLRAHRGHKGGEFDPWLRQPPPSHRSILLPSLQPPPPPHHPRSEQGRRAQGRSPGQERASANGTDGLGPTVAKPRQVRNSHTGLDLSVPQHQEVRGDMMSGHVEYQVLVVTRLAAFKSAKHRPEDVVQFLVSKKYSEIEDLYQRLSSRYPGASLPALPRKVLFVGEADIRERRAAFHAILGCVARDAQLAASPELLEFLGTRAPGAVDPGARDGPELDADGQAREDAEALDFFQQQDRGDEEEPPGSSRAGKAQEEEEEEEEEEVLDPLGIMRTKKPKKPREPAPQPQPKPWPRLTIFDEEEDPEEELFGPGGGRAPQRRPPEKARGLDPLKLFEDPDLGGAVPLGDPLLLPAARETGGVASRLGPRGTSEELFRVEEDLDQILKLGAEPPPRPRPPVAPKPVLPSKPAIPPKPGPRATTEPEPRLPLRQQAQAMDEMDILRYIREHEAPGQAAPSLF